VLRSRLSSGSRFQKNNESLKKKLKFDLGYADRKNLRQFAPFVKGKPLERVGHKAAGLSSQVRDMAAGMPNGSKSATIVEVPRFPTCWIGGSAMSSHVFLPHLPLCFRSHVKAANWLPKVICNNSLSTLNMKEVFINGGGSPRPQKIRLKELPCASNSQHLEWRHDLCGRLGLSELVCFLQHDLFSMDLPGYAGMPLPFRDGHEQHPVLGREYARICIATAKRILPARRALSMGRRRLGQLFFVTN
jgi:hypothetical protein